MHGLPAIVMTLLAGSALLWTATDGLSALTSEQVRRQAIAAAPRALPAAQLVDRYGQAFTLADLAGGPVVVDFIYTRCPTVCRAMGDTFKQLDAALPPNITLLSISFDSAHDSVEILDGYARWQGADGVRWRHARVDDAAELAVLLETFGIVVIDDGYGGFQHNAALHVVNSAGRLARVLDYDAPIDDLLAQISTPG